MVCKNCKCKACVQHKNVYCPECGHHIKYHQDGGCNQPTCKCSHIPIVNWENSIIEQEEKMNKINNIDESMDDINSREEAEESE